MALTKNVNGEVIELSPEEEAAVRAEWAAVDAAGPPVPPEVTAGRLIRALAQLDLLDSVDAAVAQADAMTKRLWDRAPVFQRNDPMIAAMAQAIGKTDADL